MPDPGVRLSVEIEVGEPVGGWVQEPNGRAERFDGWLELMRLLDRAVTAAENRGDPAADR